MNNTTDDRKHYGAANMFTPLERVLVCPPTEANTLADAEEWNYSAKVDLSLARSQHQELVALLTSSGADVLRIDEDEVGSLADSIYTHDPSLVTSAGAVLLRMGKELRRGEEAMHERTYRRLGIPILGRIEAPGTAEGGDCVWIDERTLFVGRGSRTNASGVEQLTVILAPLNVQVTAFDLPAAASPSDCLHLMSLISLLDSNLVLGMMPAMPASLFEELHRRGIQIVEAPLGEYAGSRGISANVLAVGPRDCLMVEGFPETAAALRNAGCRVRTFPGSEICTKMEGGPTCLTRPLLRKQTV